MGQMDTVEGKTNTKNGIRRFFFVGISIFLELLLLFGILFRFSENAEWIAIGTRILAALLVLGIYGQLTTPSIKMPWIILIMALPMLGAVLYFLIGLSGSTRKMRRRYEEIDAVLLPQLPADQSIRQELQKKSPYLSTLAGYLENAAGYPLYRNTDVQYYSEASEGLEAQLRDLAEAREFIFMEYHAIEDAESFHRIERILTRKAGEGVEVRLFYDDMGSIGFINTDFVKRMEAKGIRCRVFNPLIPVLNLFLNNRDHRKITVIDGKVGYTGGYNLANEYFNVTHPYGYWKDTGIRLEGDAVRSLTVTFLEMWNAVRENDLDDTGFGKYLKKYDYAAAGNGFVQPFADSPMDREQVGENVYAAFASGASDYVYYVTPYLIITEEMIFTLSMAARRGVDVRIITPGIPDKKLIYAVTRSYYSALVRSGVRIFEYTPGFCHCKMAVVDGRAAVCGTINLDYRSLYHHFENGCVIYDDPVVGEIRRDFDDMMAQSREVTEKYRTGRSSVLRIWQLILRLFAPLM